LLGEEVGSIHWPVGTVVFAKVEVTNGVKTVATAMPGLITTPKHIAVTTASAMTRGLRG
jgi:hypothetical protein